MPAMWLAICVNYMARRSGRFGTGFLLAFGTFVHELLHFVVGVLLNAKPVDISFWPEKTAQGYRLGYVGFSNLRWYNAVFVAMAPLLGVLAIFFYVDYRLGQQVGYRFELTDILAWLGIAQVMLSSWPSSQDFKIALPRKTMMSNGSLPKLYIAGPDVFAPDPIAVGERLKAIARYHGFDPLFPADNAVPVGHPNPSRFIFEKNAQMVSAADIIVANLNPFPGAESDSGTVFEVGYALGQWKRVIGYVGSSESMVSRVFAMEGRCMPVKGPYVDETGWAIEDFGHPLNLMLVHGIEHLVIGGFEDAVASLAT